MDEIRYPEKGTRALSVRYSCPEWIIELWKQSFDEDVIETMLADSQRVKPVTVRCCLNRTAPEAFAGIMEKEGVKAEPHPYLPYAFSLSGYDHLDSLDSFREGLFMVQDVSSMLVGELADPQPGDRVIDVCAAPGGKALHIAEKLYVKEKQCKEKAPAGDAVMGESAPLRGHVEARDLTEYKTDLIRENIERSGLPNISAVCMDASVPDPASAGSADIVIADLPCSGLGVLGRKTDLKYKASPEGIQSLVELQRKILSCAKEYVRPGGVLIYSTCTVDPAENMDNVHWFLGQYPEFSLDDISGRLCPELRDSVTEKGCIQLLPGVHQSDGFFIARFVKRKKQA